MSNRRGLKPCPFCGADDPCDCCVEDENDIEYWGVHCIYCSCSLDYLDVKQPFHTQAEAHEAWNKREML